LAILRRFFVYDYMSTAETWPETMAMSIILIEMTNKSRRPLIDLDPEFYGMQSTDCSGKIGRQYVTRKLSVLNSMEKG